MLTINDCLGIANLDAEEVTQIAKHEHLPFMTALEKGASLLDHPWGDAAVRQMVWDNLCDANRHHSAKVQDLMMLYHGACARHPSAFDRRAPARAAPLQGRH